MTLTYRGHRIDILPDQFGGGWIGYVDMTQVAMGDTEAEAQRRVKTWIDEAFAAWAERKARSAARKGRPARGWTPQVINGGLA